jgi:hypothetical protein
MQRETWHLSQATINSRDIFCIFLFFNPMPDATRSFLDRAEEGNMLAIIQPYAKIAINIKDPVIYQILFWIYWKKVVCSSKYVRNGTCSFVFAASFIFCQLASQCNLMPELLAHQTFLFFSHMYQFDIL